METLTIRNVEIVVVRKPIKNVHLRVYPPAGFVRVSVPQEMTDEAIRIFLIKKLGWIKQQQKEFKEVERLSPREFLQRESHYFLGERYLLEVIETEGNEKQRVNFKNKKTLSMYLKENATSEKALEVIDEFYREELKAITAEYFLKWEQKLNVAVSDWKIVKMRTKWGSCNPDKRRILINLELAKKPPRCIEYIVIHELLHFFERTHNRHFIELMDTHLSNWKALKHELNSLPVNHAEWKY